MLIQFVKIDDLRPIISRKKSNLNFSKEDNQDIEFKIKVDLTENDDYQVVPHTTKKCVETKTKDFKVKVSKSKVHIDNQNNLGHVEMKTKVDMNLDNHLKNPVIYEDLHLDQIKSAVNKYIFIFKFLNSVILFYIVFCLISGKV